MSNDKLRYALFFIVVVGWFYAFSYFNQPPRKPAAKNGQAVAAKGDEAKAKEAANAKPADAKPGDEPKKGEGESVAAKGNEKPEPAPAAAKKPEIAHVNPSELVLGSVANRGQSGYLLEVQLTQKGAGVESLASSRFEAEFEKKNPHRPLQFIQRDPKAPPSLGLNLISIGDQPAPRKEDDEEEAESAEIPLGEMDWEVVRDAKGRVSTPIPEDAATEADEQGRKIVFRTQVGDPPLIVTKTYTLKKGASDFEIELGFESPTKERSVVYKLVGPHGIPIEGEWYTYTFRDAFFKPEGSKPVTRAATEIVKGKDKPERFESLPMKYAGIENQYFAVFIEPKLAPLTQQNRWDAATLGTVIHHNKEAEQKSDIGIEIISKPVDVGPNQPVTQTYRVFAGQKTFASLEPYDATALASYRKVGWFGIPFAPEVAGVIAPLLDYIYKFTKSVAGLFGGKSGNYGVSIILLTLLVRMLMFPLGRKQAIAAKKMQDLQPHLKEIQEKYKDDKERQTKETFALYKKHGVNPVAGCLPALIQLPIFVGLWQALNTSVQLRQASFLWINNLAAPDMLFRFPIEPPYLGPYFNALPFVVVTLMLIQTKLFSPPATTPEAEMQQKIMKGMMVFMAFMFYKVPSGLGIYFITSSLWQIGERVLLPKVAAKSAPSAGTDDTAPPRGGGGGGKGPGGNGAPPAKPQGKLAQFFEKVLDEAKKDPTYRKVMGEEGDGDGEKEKNRDRARPRPRPTRKR